MFRLTHMMGWDETVWNHITARHQGMIKNGLPTIDTRVLGIKELSKLNSKDFNEKEEYGVKSRIKKIKI